jgi:excisionase family DNA binding protein
MPRDATLFVAMPFAELLELIEKSVHNAVDKIAARPVQVPEDELMNVEETCAFLRISKVTLHKWKKRKLIQSYRIGRKIFFKKKEVFSSFESMLDKRTASR